MKKLVISLVTAVLMLCSCNENPLVVKTTGGMVQGFEQEGTMAFLGIPYASVTRFMPPQRAPEWEGIRVCDHWGPQAMQNVWGRELTEDEMSENCTVLNVWTTDVKARKPVMFWLHGGGFDSGTSEWNPGMGLAREDDVVVVSVNHRLNIMGFLDLSACSPEYKYSGNVGMMDVIAALKWVRDNISRFGGDPDNITVFGESGGGGKVGTLLCMPEAKDLFHKAIIMSGTILNVNDKEMSESLGKAVLDELGIPVEEISRINDVPYKELYAAGQRAMAASIGTRAPGTPMMWGFGPTPDGEVLLQQPFQPGFAEFSNSKPIMIGTTFNELQRLSYGRELNEKEVRSELEGIFGERTDDYIAAFTEAYPDHSPADLLSIDRLFRPKTLITSDYISATRNAPTYVYMFTWKSPVNGGSVHGHELKFCFNTLDHGLNELPEPTDEDQALADLMSRSWANFARTGNPNAEGLPEWHPYTAENGEMMIFDHECGIRHNPDRKLQEIQNEFCFKQLDKFQAEHTKYFKVALGECAHGSVEVTPEIGTETAEFPAGTVFHVKATADPGYEFECGYDAMGGQFGFYNEYYTTEFDVKLKWNCTIGASFVEPERLRGYTCLHDIVYAKPGVKELRYDAYIPDGAENLPGIVIIHGGGWRMNCQNVMKGLARELIADGRYVVFSIDYRWAGKADGDAEPNSIADIIGDCYGAILHIQEHASDYGLDASRLAVTGDSAGGHLCTAVSNMIEMVGDRGFGAEPGIYEYMPTYMPKGWSIRKARRSLLAIKAVAPNYGIFDAQTMARFTGAADAAAAEALAPICHIPDASVRPIPHWINRGTLDPIISEESTAEYYQAVLDAGQVAYNVQVPGAVHAYYDWKPDSATKETFDRFGAPYARQMEDFFNTVFYPEK